ncbi:ABC transporter permease [Paracoccus lutimaris]|nr:ABC transporter permease [Paracoccus lutimaris]
MARTVVALMLREMATTYGRSAGGYIWAILEPVLGVTLLAIIFSMALAHPGLGTNFPLFYATGFLPFTMFNDLTNKVATSIRFSRPFLAYPSVTFIDTMVARVVLNALTHATVIGIVISGIFIIYQLPVVVDLVSVFEALLMITIFGVGVGTLNCYLLTAFPIWERTWQIVTRPLFLMSGVFFLYELMPAKAQAFLWYNPVLHCVGMLRHGIYPTYEASYVSPIYVVSISVILLFFGLLLLARNHRNLLER